jgi:D-alanine-D-alanine ligase
VSRTKPRVAVLYNAPTLTRDHPDAIAEAGVVATARAIARALKDHQFKSFPLAARPPVARLVRSLARKRPDVVFNLIEGFGGKSGGEARITSLLELLGLPYTGCPPLAQAIGREKGRAKALLFGSGLPTAPFWVVGPGGALPLDPWNGPVIVKPEAEDASLGIDQSSVIADPKGLARQVERVRAAYGPRVLIEAYLPGPEFNVGVLALPEPVALPVAEIVFDGPAGHWPILTYASKWHAGSAEDLGSTPRCPALIDPELAERLRTLAVLAFRATACRDYARVDFRLDAQGTPMILEVNPNPDLDPGAGWARALDVAGRDWAATLAALTRQALERGPVDA